MRKSQDRRWHSQTATWVVGAAATAAAIAACGGRASAQTTYTWNSAASANWAAGGSWDPNTAFPVAGDTAIFGNFAGPITVDLGAATQTADTVSFSQGGYTLANGTLALSTLNQAAAGTNVISARVTATGLNSTIGGGTLHLSNTATGAAANAITGTFNVNAGGTLRAGTVTGGNALGTATVTLNGGTLQLDPVASIATNGLYGRVFNATPSGATANINYTATADSDRTDTFIAAQNFTSITRAVQWVGKLNVAAGDYVFNSRSDDGSRLFIDGVLVVNSDGGHGAADARSATVSLTAGLHDIRIDFVNNSGSGSMEPKIDPPGAAVERVFAAGELLAPESGSLATPASNVIATGNAVSVAGGSTSTIHLNGNQFTAVGLASLNAAAGSTLNVTGEAGKLLRADTASLSGGGTVTWDTAANLSVGQLSDGGAATTLVKRGAGRLTLDHTTSATTLTAGTAIAVEAGTLHAVGSTVAGANFNPLGTATVRLNGGSLLLDSKFAGPTFANAVQVDQNATIHTYLAGNTVTLGSAAMGVALAPGATLTLDAAQGVTVGNLAGATLAMAGVISGDGTLNITSTGYGTQAGGPTNYWGTVTLSNANTFTGPVTVTSGALNLNATDALDASGVSVANGAILRLSVADALDIPANLAAGAVLDLTIAGGPTGSGVITRAGPGVIRVSTAAGLNTADRQFDTANVQAGDVIQINADDVQNLGTLPAGVAFELIAANRRFTLTGGTANSANDLVLNGHTITHEAVSRSVSNGTNLIRLGAGGGGFAGTTGFTLTVDEQVTIGDNVLTIGSTTPINNLAKAGTVTFSQPLAAGTSPVSWVSGNLTLNNTFAGTINAGPGTGTLTVANAFVGTINQDATGGNVTISRGANGLTPLGSDTVINAATGRTITGNVNETTNSPSVTPLTNAVGARVNVTGTVTLNANRGTDSDRNGLVHFTDVHLTGVAPVVNLLSTNSQAVRVSVVLDANGTVSNTNTSSERNAPSGDQFNQLGNVTGTATGNVLTLTGTQRIGLYGSVTGATINSQLGNVTELEPGFNLNGNTLNLDTTQTTDIGDADRVPFAVDPNGIINARTAGGDVVVYSGRDGTTGVTPATTVRLAGGTGASSNAQILSVRANDVAAGGTRIVNHFGGLVEIGDSVASAARTATLEVSQGGTNDATGVHGRAVFDHVELNFGSTAVLGVAASTSNEVRIGNLSGVGTVTATTAIPLLIEGTLRPGASIGTITSSGPVSLVTSDLSGAPAPAFEFEIQESATAGVFTDDTDRFVLSGTTTAGVLNLAGVDVLNLMPLTDITTSTTYEIATFASLAASSVFDSVLVDGIAAQDLDAGAANYVSVAYNATNIRVTVNNLTAVPEPASASALFAAAAALVGVRRRRAAAANA